MRDLSDLTLHQTSVTRRGGRCTGAHLHPELGLELGAHARELAVELLVKLAEHDGDLRLPRLARVQRRVANAELLEVLPLL